MVFEAEEEARDADVGLDADAREAEAEGTLL